MKEIHFESVNNYKNVQQDTLTLAYNELDFLRFTTYNSTDHIESTKLISSKIFSLKSLAITTLVQIMVTFNNEPNSQIYLVCRYSQSVIFSQSSNIMLFNVYTNTSSM